MIKNEMTNNEMNEMTIDLTKMIASVGVEACDGVINDLDNDMEEVINNLGFEEDFDFNDIAWLVSYEEGCKEVISYFEDYCLDEDEEESVSELKELKDLLVKLKEKTEGKNVKWVVWGVETDIALGFIE